MVRITCMHAGEAALLRLENAPRRTLAAVLADWLNMYAGVDPSTLHREHFEIAAELRRVLLAKDEWLGDHVAATILDGTDDSGVHEISIVSTEVPLVRRPELTDRVSITFEGVHESPTGAQTRARVRTTLSAEAAVELSRQLMDTLSAETC